MKPQSGESRWRCGECDDHQCGWIGRRGLVQEPLAGEVVVLATPYDAALDFAGTRSKEPAGKVVVDIPNPVGWASFDRLVMRAGTVRGAE
jgi:hypothetical protein